MCNGNADSAQLAERLLANISFGSYARRINEGKEGDLVLAGCWGRLSISDAGKSRVLS